MAQQHTELQEGLNRLLSGDHQVLFDQAISEALPATVIRLIELEKQQVADRLVDRIITGLGHKNIELRQICATCLTGIARQFVSKEYWERLDKMLPPLKTVWEGRPTMV